MDGVVSATEYAALVIETMDPDDYIGSLVESARPAFRALLFLIAQAGFGRARVVTGRRTIDAEMLLYGDGRTIEECRDVGVPAIFSRPSRRRRTWCLPAESKHVRGLAMDMSFVMYKGVTWFSIGRAADVLGLTWGGKWKVRDYGHFEV